MIELRSEQFALALPLFASMRHHLAIEAALTGCADGRVFVDAAEHPRSALVWVSHRLYFGGDPRNAAFNHDLGVWLTREVFPAARGGVFTLYPDGADWQQAVENEILAAHPPIPEMREWYELDLSEAPAPSDLSDGLPEGLVLRAVDPALAKAQGLEHLDDLLEEMQSERPSVEAFLSHSFGMVMIDTAANRLVTWCLSEYNCADRCEVGIATMEGYQRRRLATITGRAFAEQARAAGVRRVGWHCWKFNAPSSATARALGYRKAGEDLGYFIYSDPAVNLAVHGDVRLQRGDDSGAVAWFERAFACGDADYLAWAYIRAGCAAARLGQREQAFRYLNQGVDRGYANAERIKGMDHLIPLQGSAEWAVLMERIERGA